MKEQFIHNCTGCKLIAQVKGYYDIYLCRDTVLMRFGNEDYEYSSMLITKEGMKNIPMFVAVNMTAAWYNIIAKD